LAAPSANRFGKVSPTTAEHVQDEFSTLDLLVLDGGACSIGIESAIVDCSRGFAVLLRPGAIGRDALEAACGQQLLGAEELLDDAGSQPLTDARGQQPSAPLLGPAPRASGTLAAHYAPEAKLRLMSARALQTALDLLGADAAHLAVYARAAVHTSSERVILRRMPDDAAATAQQLFAVLRGFDAAGARLIWVETPPDDAAWEGVTDRLTRAAAV
jgi:L-threonylcarbamoyladenylate synthase